MGNDSAFKKSGAQTHATTEMKFENILLTGMSQTPKGKVYRCHLDGVPRQGHFVGTKGRMLITRSWGEK